KAAEIVHGMRIAIVDEKGVQNVRKIGGKSEESQWKAVCKTLWITCGERADKSRKYDQSDSTGRITQLIEAGVVTHDFVFFLPTTTTSCGLPLTSFGATRTL